MLHARTQGTADADKGGVWWRWGVPEGILKFGTKDLRKYRVHVVVESRYIENSQLCAIYIAVRLLFDCGVTP